MQAIARGVRAEVENLGRGEVANLGQGLSNDLKNQTAQVGAQIKEVADVAN